MKGMKQRTGVVHERNVVRDVVVLQEVRERALDGVVSPRGPEELADIESWDSGDDDLGLEAERGDRKVERVADEGESRRGEDGAERSEGDLVGQERRVSEGES
mgnify:CR=1 FL=1